MKLHGERISRMVEYLASTNEKKVVSKNLLRAIFRLNLNAFQDMTELPQAVRHKLVEHFGESYSTLAVRETRSDDQATKVLFACRDGKKIEAVQLAFRNHHSLCISSQVGCAFGCSFCATGKLGIIRQLTVDEITDQVFHFRSKELKSSVSFMGMGEPLSNPKVFAAIAALKNADEFNISNSRINVSTIGIAPGVMKLNQAHPDVNLTYSLHSPFPEQRQGMMPIQKVYPFSDIFPLLDYRIAQTKNRVWIAYLLLKGVNDTIDHAKALIHIIKTRPAEVRYLYHINLLPYNVAREAPSHLERTNDVALFQKELEKAGISHSYRNSFGRSIDAACGQLYADYEAKTLKIP